MSTISDQAASSARTEHWKAPKKPVSLWSDAFNRLKRNRLSVASLIFVAVLIALAIFVPYISPYGYAEQNYSAIYEGPSWSHPLGTDQLGRDILTRVIYGARISLSVGIVVQIIIVIIGVPVGIISGFYGGFIDTLLMRVVDVLYAMPNLLFIIIVMTFLGGVLNASEDGFVASLASLNSEVGGLIGVFIGLSLVSWLTVARIVRAQALSLKETEFVEAARCIGATDRQVMFRHILSNSLAPVIVAATIGIPLAILYAAGISFLGLGVTPPMPSWGLMVSQAIPDLRSYPHMLIAPAVALSLTVLAFNFLGDGLRDAFDPWMK